MLGDLGCSQDVCVIPARFKVTELGRHCEVLRVVVKAVDGRVVQGDLNFKRGRSEGGHFPGEVLNFGFDFGLVIGLLIHHGDVEAGFK